MSSISERGDSPAFFNEDGSLCREEDFVWYRDASGKIVFKSKSPMVEPEQKQASSESSKSKI